MKRLTIFLLILGAFALVDARSEGGDDPKGTKIRIGIYDNRAVTIGYVESRFHRDVMAEKKAAYQKAKAAGDQAKVKELDAWGGQYQRQLHFQGFGRAPVDDLLEPVKEKVAKLARDKQLAAITMNCDFTSEQVELVDVTEDLVKLYDPSDLEETLQTAREIRKPKPVNLAELADHKD
jgi:hypothetical protein